MNAGEIRMIAFDMDGTVLYDGAEISPRLQEIFRCAMERGVLLVPCTGRSRHQIPRSMESLGLSYTITSNGSVIRDEQADTVIRSELLDWRLTADICHDLARYGCFVCVHIDGVVYNEHPDEAYIRWKYHMPPYMEVVLTECAEATVRERKLGVEKIFVRPDSPQQRDEIRQYILGKYPVFGSSSSASNLEFSVPGCTKGSSLKWLCRSLGIEGSQVVAFGDGENDKEMLEFAGMGLAVDNALPSCKAAADEIIGACRSDGVAEFLADFF